MVMCRASLTGPEPCHCDLLAPDGTLGWLPYLPMWFYCVASFSEFWVHWGWQNSFMIGAAYAYSGVIFTCNHGFLVAVPVITWLCRLITPDSQEVTAHFRALLAHLYTIAGLLDLKNAVRAATGWRGTLMAECWIQFCQHCFSFSALPQSLIERDLFCESKRYNCMLNLGVSFEASLLNFVRDKPYYIGGSAFRLICAL
jgi:hypothetical protein